MKPDLETKIVMVDLSIGRSQADLLVQDPSEAEQERIINENTKRNDRSTSGSGSKPNCGAAGQ